MSNPEENDGKEEIVLELTEEELVYLQKLAKERGTSIDKVVESILEEVISLEEDEFIVGLQ